jgi:M6 family metalloprotease-like protein
MSHPFFDEEFTFIQPDGSSLRVKGWGDQEHAVFETLDGFTVIEDPATGFHSFAALAKDGASLVATGARPGPDRPETLGLVPGIRSTSVARDAALSSLPTPLWRIRRERARESRRLLSATAVWAPPGQQTTGEYLGLCLLIQFPDVPGAIDASEVEAFCNKSNYANFGNNGSVRDYFADNSIRRLRYATVVAPYYTARHDRAYYTDPNVPYGHRARELVNETLNHHKARGQDFGELTSTPEGHVRAINVFYAGDRVNKHRQGLWPHASTLSPVNDLGNRKYAADYQITDLGKELSLGTYCHENGHMLCDFPDLYDLGSSPSGPESWGAGNYCLMSYGGKLKKGRNPANISAYLKLQAGWAGSITQAKRDLKATLVAGRNDFYIHAKSPTEYFIIENRCRHGRDAALPDSGVTIWHVDEAGSNDNEQGTPTQHYECALVQADGNLDLERRKNAGDAFDLFHTAQGLCFSDVTTPSSKWWDRTNSGLEILDVHLQAERATFTINVRTPPSGRGAGKLAGFARRFGVWLSSRTGTASRRRP